MITGELGLYVSVGMKIYNVASCSKCGEAKEVEIYELDVRILIIYLREECLL